MANMEVWVRAKLLKQYTTGECDVQLNYPGAWDAPIECTMAGKDVVAKAEDHNSDCAVHNMPAFPNRECNCGSL